MVQSLSLTLHDSSKGKGQSDYHCLSSIIFSHWSLVTPSEASWRILHSLSFRFRPGTNHVNQGCIFRLTCSHPQLTEDHVLTSAYVKIFRTCTKNAVNKSVWRKKDCSWLPLNKHAMNIWLSSLRIRAHLSWRTGKHLHVLHVLRTYSTCSYPGYQDTTTYAALQCILQRPKKSELSGWQLSTRKNFPDEVRKSFSRKKM